MSQTGESKTPVVRPDDAFEFGRNWERYVEEYLDPERIAIAAESVRELVGEPLIGKTFLDIGSGSGLFSLVAFEDGAARVLSLDVDPNSVASTRRLRAVAGEPTTWDVLEGSILDATLVERLPQADVVYSWGVLHHTGDMYNAIRHAASLVKPQGLFVIAIYNRVENRFLSSDRWHTIKRAYNHSTRPVQRLMEFTYATYFSARLLAGRQNPMRYAREYKASRGMALRTDLIDWLGGYPYEYATVDEIVDFCRTQCGMDLLRTVRVPSRGTGNNQFVFRRAES